MAVITWTTTAWWDLHALILSHNFSSRWWWWSPTCRSKAFFTHSTNCRRCLVLNLRSSSLSWKFLLTLLLPCRLSMDTTSPSALTAPFCHPSQPIPTPCCTCLRWWITAFYIGNVSHSLLLRVLESLIIHSQGFLDYFAFFPFDTHAICPFAGQEVLNLTSPGNIRLTLLLPILVLVGCCGGPKIRN